MKALIMAGCIALLMTGCATTKSARPHEGGTSREPFISMTNVKPVSCKIPIVVELDASSGATFLMPDEINVCTAKQDVYWYAKGAKKFEIRFREDKTNASGKAKLKKDRADCEADTNEEGALIGWLCKLDKNDHVHGGTIEYEFHAIAANNDPIDHDPRLIILP